MRQWRELLVGILLRLYVLLLRLYPRPFREAFAEEIAGVFARRMEEMARAGFGRLSRACLREYRDLLRLLLAERWSDLKQGGREMKRPDNDVFASPSQVSSRGVPSSWAGALLAGLPHLLVPAFFLSEWLLQSLNIWGRTPGRGLLEPGFFALVVVMLLVAWRRGWPRWSGSWAGYASASLFIVLLSSLSYLFMINPGLSEQATNASLMAWLVLSMVMVVVLARRDPLAALLAILSISLLLNYAWLDEVQGDEPLFLGFALATAVAAVFVARAKQTLVGVGLVVAINVPMAILVSYYSIYRSATRSTPLPVEPDLSVMLRQTIMLLTGFALWLVPLLLLFAWRRVRRWRMSP